MNRTIYSASKIVNTIDMRDDVDMNSPKGDRD